MAMIEFQDVQKYYGDFHALKDINLKIEAGETVVLIGPSGSGKSTLIRTVNGLEPIQEGKLIVNGQDLANKKTDPNRIRKNVGMVFQHFNLYANKTVLENIMLAPRIVLKRPEAENKKICNAIVGSSWSSKPSQQAACSIIWWSTTTYCNCPFIGNEA